MKRVTVLVLFLSSLLPGGCLSRTPYENYPAGSLTEQQVATLRLSYIKKIVDEGGNTILELGQYDVAERFEYRLRPGRYQVVFNLWGWGFFSKNDALLNYEGVVDFKPGHRYEVKYQDCSVFDIFRDSCRKNSYKSYMWLEDVGTGEVLIQ